MADTAKISIDGKTIDFADPEGHDRPRCRSTSGNSTPRADAFTYDPGFTSTASCESKITFIDGDAGILLHRGYQIGETGREIETSSTSATCLLHGELPKRERVLGLRAQRSPITPCFTSSSIGFFQGFPSGCSPDGDHDRRGRRPVPALLSRPRRTSTIRSSA